MYIKLCDRCGRVTRNKAAFLLPTSAADGSYQVDGAWFGKPVCLCNDCLKKFKQFRENHEVFNCSYLQSETEMQEVVDMDAWYALSQND